MCLVPLLRDERILRQSRAVVTIVDAPDNVKAGAQVWTTAQAMFSRPEQLINGISHTTGKMASFEPDFWRLDGSFMLPVAPSQSQMEIGFVSSQMSDEGGEFNTPPQITIEFPSARNLPLVALVFDHATGEAAKRVRIQAFNANDVVVLDETVVNNPKGLYCKGRFYNPKYKSQAERAFAAVYAHRHRQTAMYNTGRITANRYEATAQKITKGVQIFYISQIKNSIPKGDKPCKTA